MRVIRELGLLGLLLLPGLAAGEPLAIYGRYEQVRLEGLGQTLAAKMDTGALTASLSARDIRYFQRDGADWVRFRLALEGQDRRWHEYPLARVAGIRLRREEQEDSGEPAARRPVIEMPVCVGRQRQTIEINLADRSGFRYPLLMGARAIGRLGAAIDPQREYLAGRPACASE